MSSVTSFLRDLAAKTTAHIDALVAQTRSSGVALPPLAENPPVAEALAIAPALGLPVAGPVGVAGGRSGGAPAGVPSAELVNLAPISVAAPHAEREAGNNSAPPAAEPSAAAETCHTTWPFQTLHPLWDLTHSCVASLFLTGGRLTGLPRPLPPSLLQRHLALPLVLTIPLRTTVWCLKLGCTG